jgi:hypothetical protein
MICFEAIGSAYTASGWSPEGSLFSILVPAGDELYALEYARRHAVQGVSGLATHGCERVTGVVRVPAERRRPRNANPDRPGRIMLPPAPDQTKWTVVAIRWKGVTLERQPHVGEDKPPPVQLTWLDLRQAAEGDRWYRDLLTRCEAASF